MEGELELDSASDYDNVNEEVRSFVARQCCKGKLTVDLDPRLP